MIEYQVRSFDDGATGPMEKLLNDLAREDWRLVSTAVFTEGTHRPRLYVFLEREVGEREKQDEWRAQHGGRAAG